MYRIIIASSRVEKELSRIPEPDRGRVVERMKKLAEDPRPKGVRALAPDVYRLRIGAYRVVYKVYDDEKVVLIGRIARRSEKTYRDFEELF